MIPALVAGLLLATLAGLAALAGTICGDRRARAAAIRARLGRGSAELRRAVDPAPRRASPPRPDRHSRSGRSA